MSCPRYFSPMSCSLCLFNTLACMSCHEQEQPEQTKPRRPSLPFLSSSASSPQFRHPSSPHLCLGFRHCLLEEFPIQEPRDVVVEVSLPRNHNVSADKREHERLSLLPSPFVPTDRGETMKNTESDARKASASEDNYQDTRVNGPGQTANTCAEAELRGKQHKLRTSSLFLVTMRSSGLSA
eukprot:768466-Hanusia_phi.AAC.7